MRMLLLLALLGLISIAPAQVTNNWIKPGSGDWQEQTAWSLGTVPAQNQTIMLTNYGWKAIAIGSATAANFPQSLNVQSVILGGYTDSFNVLLLNYAGFQVPLTAGSINVGTNSGITMLSSALTVSTNSGPGDLSIFSAIDQGDLASVNAHLINLGNVTNSAAGFGTYNQTNGIVNADELSEAYGSTFNQFDGANDIGTLWMGAANSGSNYGTYNMVNGYLTAGSIIAYRGNFNQTGGSVAAGLGLGNATYTLSGGILNLPGINIPYVPSSSRNPGVIGISANATLLQTGGTNFCNGSMTAYHEYGSPAGASFIGPGYYVLSNGVLCVSGSVSAYLGTFEQWGGWHTNAATQVGGDTGPHDFTIRPGSFTLGGGTLITPSISVGLGGFTQSGGTNQVSGDVVTVETPTTFTLSGGLLTDLNTTVDGSNPATPGPEAALFMQSAGTHIVTNLLRIFGPPAEWFGQYYSSARSTYVLSGGVLNVPNITMVTNAFFQHDGGTLMTSGLLTLGYATWTENTTGQQFGQLLLSARAGTNATFALPSSGNCIVRLANSSVQAWSAGVSLYINNWHGSPSGGGATQFYFGSNSSGLTAQQLSQVQFNNPAGLPAGTYPAKILSTGEIVPNQSTAPPEVVNNWINPSSDKWENSSSWSLGTLPASNETVNITNAGYKAVNIDSATVSGFSNSLTVSNLTIGITPNAANTLLLNFAGTTTPLRVLNNLGVETNGHVLMLYSAMNVSNALHVSGLFDQEGGILTLTNSPASTMQIEGGTFNLTNGLVTGANMYLGGTNDGYVNQDSGLVSLDSLDLGTKLFNPNYPNDRTGTYLLQGGWLIVGGPEVVGHIGSGTLTQNGGTNSASEVSVAFGNYNKNGGSLFAGTLLVDPPSGPIPPNPTMTHAGGSTVITNDLHLFSPGNGLHDGMATFNMVGGSLSANSLMLGDASAFNQSSGAVNVATGVILDGCCTEFDYASYALSGGSLGTSNMTIASKGSMNQTGGTCVVTNTLSIGGGDRDQAARYQLSAGTVTAPNIVLTGGSSGGFSFYNSPSFAMTNQNISLIGGGIDVQNSTQQIGRVTLGADSTVYLIGNAIVRFADSHTNSWQAQTQGTVPQLTVPNWNGSTNGGGAEQLIFGASSSALTPGQLAQISFVNPAGFPSGTYPARILLTGEVVPTRPTLLTSRRGSAIVLTWPSGYQLLSGTNVTGPYTPVPGATSPWTNGFTKPRQFFKLQSF